jgi:flagellar basal-body rod modification protein FlgD
MSAVSGTSLTNLFSAGVDLPAAQTQAALDNRQLFGDFNSFLLLLTAQLKNQDPLEPMDTAQFTQQLVQFANVEQSIKTNSQLDKLIAASASNKNTQALSYLGKEVSIEGKSFMLEAGSSKTFSYFTNNPSQYQKVRVTILNENNAPVRSIEMPTSALKKGLNDFEWDGRNDNGIPVKQGRYSVSVLGFKDATSTDPLTTIMKGIVQSVGTEGDQVFVTVDDLLYPESLIISINEPKPTAQPNM